MHTCSHTTAHTSKHTTAHPAVNRQLLSFEQRGALVMVMALGWLIKGASRDTVEFFSAYGASEFPQKVSCALGIAMRRDKGLWGSNATRERKRVSGHGSDLPQLDRGGSSTRPPHRSGSHHQAFRPASLQSRIIFFSIMVFIRIR